MAAKKKTVKKSNPGLSGTTRSVKVKPKKKYKRKNMLSASMEEAGKSTISGAFGGALSLLFDYIIPDTANPAWKGAAKIAGGFAIAKFTGMKSVGAGMAGVGVSDLLRPKLGLSEGGANWAKQPQPLPMFLTENGQLLTEGQARLMLTANDNQPMPKRTDNSYLPNFMPSYV